MQLGRAFQHKPLTKPKAQTFDLLVNDGGLSAILPNGTAKPDNKTNTNQANKSNTKNITGAIQLFLYCKIIKIDLI
ncbi:hypothetical protein [Snodgrassella communis]|uniref:hypothetical protein n=1 Tax=Snodgrassella communis TaxID=2946699 RepID=UPI001EF5E0AB|nr:hypothetical protein [Snodgrassella communis]